MVLHVWKKFLSLISILIFAKDYQHIIKGVGFEDVNKMIIIIKRFSDSFKVMHGDQSGEYFMLLLRLNPLAPVSKYKFSKQISIHFL